MKKSLAFLIIGLLVLASCSDDDGDGNGDQNLDPIFNYFPTVIDNSWTFENTVTAPNQQDIVSNETLTLSGSAQASGNTVYTFETDNPVNSAPTTSALSQGEIFKNGASVIYTGTIGFASPGLPDLSINVENVSILNSNSNSGTELSSQSGDLNESFEGIPVTIEYTLTTEMSDTFESIDVQGITYNNVISADLIINLKIIANITDPFPIDFTVLESQDAVIIKNYFANEVGLIKSESSIDLDFQSIPTLPIEDINFNINQELTSSNIQLD